MIYLDLSKLVQSYQDLSRRSNSDLNILSLMNLDESILNLDKSK